MRQILFVLLLFSACSKPTESCNGIPGPCQYPSAPVDGIQADEMTGVPIRPLEWKVPGYPNLPTPADALTMDGLPSGSSDAMMSAEIQGDGVILSSVGFYSRGKIWSYYQFQTNDLWTVRNPARAYANYFIEEPMFTAAREYYAKQPDAPKLMLWDISKNGGGEIDHTSHQLGLDADIEYPYLPGTKVKSEATIDYEKTWSLVKAMVGTGKIQRMFTDTPIKRRLCQLAAGDPEKGFAESVLRKLRYWPGHYNHVHFRFYCPPGDNLCVPQVEVPPGSGCNGAGGWFQ